MSEKYIIFAAEMKKWLYILLLPFMLCACEPYEFVGDYSDYQPKEKIYLYEGSSYHVAYTIVDEKVYEGTSYRVAYTIKDDKVYERSSYHVAYTIKNDKVYERSSYHVAYTIKKR